jgi:peptide/nickel transport system ATP-binding protein
VIPPEDLDIEQERYREVMFYRQRVEARDIDLDAVRERAAAGGSAGRAVADGGSGFDATLRDQFFDGPLSGAAAADAVEASFDHLADGDWAAAEDVLRETFESVCETSDPSLGDEDDGDGHPVACHLFEDS